MAERNDTAMARWADNQMLIVVSRIASVLGTGLAGVGIWIFLQVWHDLREVRTSVTAAAATLAVQSVRLDAHDKQFEEHGRRIDRVERKVFP